MPGNRISNYVLIFASMFNISEYGCLALRHLIHHASGGFALLPSAHIDFRSKQRSRVYGSPVMTAAFPSRDFDYRFLDNSEKLRRLDDKAARQKAEHEKIMLGKRVALVPEPKQLWKLLPDKIVNNYEILYEIGRGGYGCVVLAKARKPVEGLPPLLAIKLCRPQQGEIPVMLKEGFAMRRVSSPLVARCYEMGCDARAGGVVWFAMEHLEGRTLHELLIERGPMSSAEVCRVGIDLLEGLSRVHAAGLIHRDVKPQNIVRVHEPAAGPTNPWRYKLIDFGTATGTLGPDRVALPSLTARLEDRAVGDAGVTERAILSAAFAGLDRDSDGRLGAEDLVAAMRGLGLPADRAHALSMVARYDSDRSGSVDPAEFGAMYGELAALPLSALALGPAGAPPAPALRSAFAAVDADSDGRLDLAELEACFGPAFSARRPGRARLAELLARYDADGDGSVSAAEFAAMYGELAALQDAMTASGTHGSVPRPGPRREIRRERRERRRSHTRAAAPASTLSCPRPAPPCVAPLLPALRAALPIPPSRTRCTPLTLPPPSGPAAKADLAVAVGGSGTCARRRTTRGR